MNSNNSINISILEKNREHINPNIDNNTVKYHINSLNSQSLLENIKNYDKYLIDNYKFFTQEMFVISAALRDNLVNGNVHNRPHIIIKMSTNSMIIERDYYINQKIKNIPGFISYNTLFKCFDDTKAKIIKKIEEKYNTNTYGKIIRERNNYENNVKVTELTNIEGICSANKDTGLLYNVIVMPFIKSKSMKQKEWKDTIEDKLKLRSLLKQILLSYLAGFVTSKFIHIDNHFDNFLMKKTTKEIIEYQIEDKTISIQSKGLQVVIIDFDKSIDNVYNSTPFKIFTETDFIKNFFENIENLFDKVFNNIRLDKTEILLKINNIKKTNNIFNIIELLDTIDNLDYTLREI